MRTSRIGGRGVRVVVLSAAAALVSLAVGACGAKTPESATANPPATAPVAGAVAVATRPATAATPLVAPTLADGKPADFPGLHNVVAFAKDVYSGSVPEGAAGFDSLVRLGVRSIVTVDGAEPELDLAKSRGLRYVHLPVTYSGFSEQRKLEIARAVRDLPKPVYVHCHHGKHRSAGAAGAAVVTLGWLTPDEAVARMKVSGTAPGYKGLYACASEAGPVLASVLDAVSGDFPEVDRPKGTVKAMIDIDVASDHLKAIQKAGWKAPADHPALAPAAEAGKLADLLRYLKDDEYTKKQPPAYLTAMLESSRLVTELEDALAKGGAATADLDKKMAAVQKSCKDCHVTYRD